MRRMDTFSLPIWKTFWITTDYGRFFVRYAPNYSRNRILRSEDINPLRNPLSP
jgi:hypothetical protein